MGKFVSAHPKAESKSNFRTFLLGGRDLVHQSGLLSSFSLHFEGDGLKKLVLFDRKAVAAIYAGDWGDERRRRECRAP